MQPTKPVSSSFQAVMTACGEGSLVCCEKHKELTIQRAVELLGELAVQSKDNPYVPEATDWIGDEARARIQAWEEAPLLDEISVNAGYRATVMNLGLVGIKYHRLDEYVEARDAGDRAGSRHRDRGT